MVANIKVFTVQKVLTKTGKTYTVKYYIIAPNFDIASSTLGNQIQ